MSHQNPIGDCTSRTDLLNYLINRYNFSKYLEIGCQGDANFRNVHCTYKVGVDPEAGGTLRCTSDSFFETCNESFDLVFIDGLHECQQVNRDISNALKVLNPGGIIVMHDCNPQVEVDATYPVHPQCSGLWNGDCYKALVLWRTYSHVDACVGEFDWGCGVIVQRPNTCPITLCHSYSDLPWSTFEQNRKVFLRTMSFEQLKDWLP